MDQRASPHYSQLPDTPDTASRDPTSPPPVHSVNSINSTAATASNGAGSPAAGPRKGVRTLTDAQLEKKRANDRDAQRAIRDRTKRSIETLERRIKDLESGQEFRQLQDVLRQRDAVEAENAALKQSLRSVIELLQPLMHLLHIPNDVLLPRPSSNAGPLQNASEYKPVMGRSPAASAVMRASVIPSVADYDRPTRLPDINRAHENARNRDTYIEWSNSTGDSHRQAAASGPAWEPSDPSIPERQTASPSSAMAAMQPPSLEYENDLKRKRDLFNDLDRRKHYPTNQTHFSRGPAHSQLPWNIAPTCRLDTILFDYASDARKRLSCGTPLRNIIGPSYPVFNAVVNPDVSMQDHSMSELLIELMKGFSGISATPDRVSVIAHMHTVLKWFINPTEETYQMIPEWARPVEEQLKVAHPIWIDYIVWPRMRAKMVYQYPQLPLDHFFLPYSTTVSANFHSTDSAACLYNDPPNNEELLIRPELEAHWRVLENWTVGSFFATSLPALADTCQIRRSATDEMNGAG